MRPDSIHPDDEAWFRDVLLSGPPSSAAHPPLVLRVDGETERHGVHHRHNDFYALYIVRQGRGRHLINGVSYSVSRGDVYAMAPGFVHAYASIENLLLDAFYFQIETFDEATLDALAVTPGVLSLFALGEREEECKVSGDGGRWLHLTPGAYASVMDAVTELRREWRDPSPVSAILTRTLFARLLVMMARFRDLGGQEPSTPRVTRETVVAEAVRYIDAHYADPIRVEQLAALVFLSPDRFTQVFSAAMGRTPSDYLRHVRIERARHLLTTTELPISEIGELVGFAEPAYFSRVFKSETGRTPSESRKT